jgi:putative Mg2+ transporter-C (MgtC) family protein
LKEQKKNKPAGIRTHALVCIGSAVFTLVSAYGFHDFATIRSMDPARIAAQVVSGIGFLGAGIIWKEGYNIRGLTTAANIWITAGLGMALGSGLYYPVFVSVILIYVALKINDVLKKFGIIDYDCKE